MNSVKNNVEYIVYKTTCLIDNKFYIGSHYGPNASKDEYLGSGKIIVNKIKILGKENFKRDILGVYPNIEEMKKAELKFIISFFKDDLNINLSKLSGGGDLGEFKEKPLLQMDKNCNIIKEWPSLKDLCRVLPIASKARSNSKYLTKINFKYKRRHANGFLWVYKQDLEKIIPERLLECNEFLSNRPIKSLSPRTSKPFVCVLMDVHINSKNYNLIENLFDQLIEHNLKRGCRMIFQCGDIFDSRTGQPLECLLTFKRILIKLEESGMVMFCIPGNHDKTDLESELSFLSIYDSHPNFYLMHKEEVIDWIHPDYNFCFLPYFKEEFSYPERLENIKNIIKSSNRKSILLTHIGVNGVKNNDGSKVENSLKGEKFKEFEKVLVAHYHNKSKVGNNVFYLGSMKQANFGEDQEKGFHYLHNNGELEQIILDFPKFIKLAINVNDVDSEFLKDVEQVKKDNPEINLRIVLQGKEEEINSFNKNRLLDLGISVDKKPEDVELLDPEEEIEVVSYNKENLTEAFEEFCKFKNIEQNEYGLKLLQKL